LRGGQGEVSLRRRDGMKWRGGKEGEKYIEAWGWDDTEGDDSHKLQAEGHKVNGGGSRASSHNGKPCASSGTKRYGKGQKKWPVHHAWGHTLRLNGGVGKGEVKQRIRENRDSLATKRRGQAGNWIAAELVDRQNRFRQTTARHGIR